MDTTASDDGAAGSADPTDRSVDPTDRSADSTDRSADPTDRSSLPDGGFGGRRFRAALAALSLAVGVLVLVVAHDLFPYHSVNHDEGVYLQQAAMVLDGQIRIAPPLGDAMRPWFFVDDGGTYYSKYSPVAPALYAPGLAVGAPRVILGFVAAASAALVGLLGREAFDERTGLLAVVLLATAPLFVFSSSAFLSYAPTTALNLLFALAYVRSVRRRSLRDAVVAGIAVGLAFFSRPYTAVLFALPFVAHACLTLVGAWRQGALLGATSDGADGVATDDGRTAPDSSGRSTSPLARIGTIAALGVAFVGVSLGYNALTTGDPLVFPYQAFAPEDGVGFGRRQIRNHEAVYSVGVALEANWLVVRRFAIQWAPLGGPGTALAAVGLGAGLAPAVRQARRRGPSLPGSGTFSDHTVRTLLAGVVVTVVAGNVAFWGNFNILADFADPTDGLIAHLGPFYHFDLVAPTAVFGAAGSLVLWDRLRAAVDGADSTTAANAALALVVVCAVVLGGASTAAAVDPVVDRNAEYTEDLTTLYEPIERTDFEDAVVFVPTTYGEWLNHPYQWLRNDGDFDGDAVYVQNQGIDTRFAAVETYSDRTPYRFTTRGEWPPVGDGETTGVLRPLSIREGERLRATTEVGVVAGAETASVRLAADDRSVQYGVERLDGETTGVEWEIAGDRLRVVPDGLSRYSENATVPVDGPTTATLTVTFVQPGGATITYRQEVSVDPTDGGVRVVWPPEQSVCRLTTDCGTEGTYVEGGDYATGVSLNATLAVESGNRTEAGS